ncbi:MAG: hypothetical protein ABIC91_02345 [Nanoarchaeota archaeon]|nr:hypothetical protein [Nanoarchaeota archaeon]MBU1030122.1 hypothetical protein [Nanoarchaeota archaeon]MBU1850630.1 hypothetical protein [Nanoarchaeota archaeon]
MKPPKIQFETLAKNVLGLKSSFKNGFAEFISSVQNLLKSLHWHDASEELEVGILISSLTSVCGVICGKLQQMYDCLIKLSSSMSKEDFEKFVKINQSFRFVKSMFEKDLAKLDSKIVSYFESLSNKQALFDFKKSFAREKELFVYSESFDEKIMDSFSNLAFLFEKKNEESLDSGLFSNFLKARFRPKRRDRIVIGKSVVNLTVQSVLNMKHDKLLVGSTQQFIFSYIIDNCDKLILHENLSSGDKSFLNSIKKKSSGEIEKDLLNIASNTVISVLKQNPRLLRSRKTNILIKLLPFNENKSSLGSYERISSDSNISLKWMLTKDFVDTYLDGVHIIYPHMHAYETIAHELSHSFDLWNKSADSEDYVFARKILGRPPIPSQVISIKALLRLRKEGFARMSGYVKSMHDDFQKLFLLNIGFLSKSISKSELNLEQIFEYAQKSDSSFDLVSDRLEQCSKIGDLHNLGQYMMLVIFVSDLGKNFHFRICKDSKRVLEKLFVHTVSEQHDLVFLTQKYNWQIVAFNEVGGCLEHQLNLFAFVEKRDYHLVEDFFQKVSLLDPFLFFQKYLHSCDVLGIKPLAFAQRMVEELHK